MSESDKAPVPRARAILTIAATGVALAAADTYVVVLALTDMMTGVGVTIDALQKDALLTGTDAVGATLRDADAIRAFEAAHVAANPWLA